MVPLFYFGGCGSSKSDNPVDVLGKSDNPADVSGKWVSYSVTDRDGNTTVSLPSFTLELNQNDHDLNGTLAIVEFGITEVIGVSGYIDGVDFNLSGQFSQGDIQVNGLWENNDSMQMTVAINVDENDQQIGIVYYALMRKAPLSEISFSINSFTLEQKCGDSGEDIILVHGLMSDATKWNTMINHFRDSGICETNRVWTYQYDWLNHITQTGQDFVTKVGEQPLIDKPVIIASSMGGLVVRSYIKQGGRFERLITIATPHLGSALTELIGTFPGIQDMEPGSDFLNELNSDAFEASKRTNYLLLNGKVNRTWVCTKRIRGVCVRGYYEWAESYPTIIKAGYVLLSKPNDGMVPQSSSRFDGDEQVSRADANAFEWIHHTGLPVNERVIDFISNQL